MTPPFFRRVRPKKAGPRSVTDLDPGESATISGIESLDPSRLVKLSSLGLMRWVRIRLVQSVPAVVIQVAETTVALDPDVARDIRVD